MSSSLTEQVEVAQRHSTSSTSSPSAEPQDVGAVVAKAKKAAASLWMILHAQVSVLSKVFMCSCAFCIYFQYILSSKAYIYFFASTRYLHILYDATELPTWS